MPRCVTLWLFCVTMHVEEYMRETFYDGAAWRRKRAAILRRDKYLCRRCARFGRHVPAVIVHHIVPYEERPDLGLRDDNLISLCAACHNAMHPERPVAWRSPPRGRG